MLASKDWRGEALAFLEWETGKTGELRKETVACLGLGAVQQRCSHTQWLQHGGLLNLSVQSVQEQLMIDDTTWIIGQCIRSIVTAGTMAGGCICLDSAASPQQKERGAERNQVPGDKQPPAVMHAPSLCPILAMSTAV